MNQHPSGLSISTGLAIETLVNIPRLDPARIVPSMPYPLEQYDVFYVNILTLIRNAISAHSADELIIASGRDIAYFCISELNILASTIPIPMIPYMSRYTRLGTPSLKPYLREHTTPRQHKIDNLTTTAAQAMTINDNSIKQYSWNIPGTQNNAIVLSHIILDLYSYKGFNVFTLLESNTGVLKSPSLYGSKYYNIDDETVPYIPFNLKSGLVLGDSTVFKPMPLKVRRQYLAAAIDKRWSGVTPPAKVLHDLSDAKYDLAKFFYSQLPSF
jgi:hypothetical protein